MRTSFYTYIVISQYPLILPISSKIFVHSPLRTTVKKSVSIHNEWKREPNSRESESLNRFAETSWNLDICNVFKFSSNVFCPVLLHGGRRKPAAPEQVYNNSCRAHLSIRGLLWVWEQNLPLLLMIATSPPPHHLQKSWYRLLTLRCGPSKWFFFFYFFLFFYQ